MNQNEGSSNSDDHTVIRNHLHRPRFTTMPQLNSQHGSPELVPPGLKKSN